LEKVGITVAATVLAGTGIAALVISDLNAPPDPGASRVAPAPMETIKHSEGFDDVYDLEFPGVTDGFVRRVNAKIPWTVEIGAPTLISVAQDVCSTLSRGGATAEAQAMVQEAGFTGPESALFVAATSEFFPSC